MSEQPIFTRRPENSRDDSVRSVPLDTDDGGAVVIAQQNTGPGNQVGGGEFKNTNRRRSPDQAAAEQDELEAREPTPTNAVHQDAAQESAGSEHGERAK